VIREEIAKIERGEWDKNNNPIKNAPHTQQVCISSDWNRPYSRETAAYPTVFIFEVYKTLNFIFLF
jgi:glycine dehydrogenase